MPSSLRTVVEKVATTAGTPINRGRARIMNEPVWHNAGLRCWIDGAHVNSQPTSDSPVTGTTVTDLAQGTTPAWTIPSGTVSYAGNGWDFSGGTAFGNTGANRLTLPATIAADIWGDGTANQYFGVVLYAKLQAEADWNPTTAIMPYIHFDSDNGLYTDPSMVSISSVTDGSGQKVIRVYRPVSTSVRDQIDIVVPTAAFGKFAQLAVWRDAAGLHVRLRYDNGATGADVVGAIPGLGNATGNFSVRVGRIGLSNGYASYASAGAARKWKLYAAGVENLRTSTRDFGAVIDSDWTWRFAMKNAGIYA